MGPFGKFPRLYLELLRPELRRITHSARKLTSRGCTCHDDLYAGGARIPEHVYKGIDVRSLERRQVIDRDRRMRRRGECLGDLLDLDGKLGDNRVLRVDEPNVPPFRSWQPHLHTG